MTRRIGRPGAGSLNPCPGALVYRLALTAALLLGVPAAAQDRYRLEPEGTWTKLTRDEPASNEGQLKAVRRLLARNRTKVAHKALTAWIKKNPKDPLLPEAYLLRGDAKALAGDYYKSLYDYEYVLRKHPESNQFHTAIQREFKIARLFEAGMRRKLLGLRIINTDDEAEELFIRIQERAPGTDLGQQASMALGDFYFSRGDMDSAVEAYDLFLVNYERSHRRECAMHQIIRAHLARFRDPRYDASSLIEAIGRIGLYQLEFPAEAERMGAQERIAQIVESLARKDLLTARWFDRRGQHVSAMVLYRRIFQPDEQDELPESAYAQTTAANLARRRYEALAVRMAIPGTNSAGDGQVEKRDPETGPDP